MFRVLLCAACCGLAGIDGAGHVQAARLPVASALLAPSATLQSIRLLAAHTTSAPGAVQSPQSGSAIEISEQHALLKRYCVSCHSGPAARARLELDKMDVDDVSRAPEAWEKVVRKLRAGVMPPAG